MSPLNPAPREGQGLTKQPSSDMLISSFRPDGGNNITTATPEERRAYNVFLHQSRSS